MMVPTKDYANLVNYYKGQITESTLLNKAGRLAAERRMILSNPSIPDAMAVQMVQPKARELNRLTKRIRMGHVRFAPSPTIKDDEDEDGDEEDDASMLNAPLENTLKKLLKRTKTPIAPKTPAPPSAPPKLIDFDEEEKKDVKPKDLIDFDEKPKKTSGWGKAMGKGGAEIVGCQNRSDLGRRGRVREGRATPAEKEKRQTTQRKDALSQVQEKRNRGLETATGLGRLYGRQETAPSPGGRVWRGNAPNVVETQAAEKEDVDKHGRPPVDATS